MFNIRSYFDINNCVFTVQVSGQRIASRLQLLITLSLFVRRIFVNRSLHLENIKFYGFDMDYTLAGEYRATNEVSLTREFATPAALPRRALCSKCPCIFAFLCRLLASDTRTT